MPSTRLRVRWPCQGPRKPAGSLYSPRAFRRHTHPMHDPAREMRCSLCSVGRLRISWNECDVSFGSAGLTSTTTDRAFTETQPKAISKGARRGLNFMNFHLGREGAVEYSASTLGIATTIPSALMTNSLGMREVPRLCRDFASRLPLSVAWLTPASGSTSAPRPICHPTRAFFRCSAHHDSLLKSQAIPSGSTGADAKPIPLVGQHTDPLPIKAKVIFPPGCNVC
jgi:hypothetical protein